ncbi:hypothetical protein LSAT2_010805 [Lamellibrachia satsuma]|nr:hypothetical protein LSAT2_010805 [Lamellibrachia satsuma]
MQRFGFIHTSCKQMFTSNTGTRPELTSTQEAQQALCVYLLHQHCLVIVALPHTTLASADGRCKDSIPPVFTQQSNKTRYVERYRLLAPPTLSLWSDPIQPWLQRTADVKLHNQAVVSDEVSCFLRAELSN